MHLFLQHLFKKREKMLSFHNLQRNKMFKYEQKTRKKNKSKHCYKYKIKRSKQKYFKTDKITTHSKQQISSSKKKGSLYQTNKNKKKTRFYVKFINTKKNKKN